MTKRATVANPKLRRCLSCGGYNPHGFNSCSGCGKLLCVTLTGWLTLAKKKPQSRAASQAAPFSTAPMWPMWSLINLTTKPRAPGSGNHRSALMRAREWQTYLIGLMHLPGLLAFSGKTNDGGSSI